MRATIRAFLRVLPIAWTVVPPVALLVAVAAGWLGVAPAADLAIWLAAPWALILASLLTANAALGIGRRRWE
jgi:hypothetical protein